MSEAAVEEPQVLHVDFNETDERRNVVALRTRENRRVSLSIGDFVKLRDEDGFYCFGVVRRASGKAYRVAPQWSTWRNPEPVRINSRPEPMGDMLVTLWQALPTVNTEQLVK